MKFLSRSPSKRRVILKSGLIALVIGFGLGWNMEPPPSKEVASYWGDLDKEQPKSQITARKGCRINTFGVYPWLKPGSPRDDRWAGVTTQALTFMGMPAEAAGRAVARLRDGHPDEAVLIGDTHGLGSVSGQVYYPAFTTTYKSVDYTVCVDTATNFGNAYRQEAGLLYKIVDASGKTWHVGEMLACGNVSLFYPAPEGWMQPQPVQGTREVPESSTLLLILIAFAVWAYIRRKQ